MTHVIIGTAGHIDHGKTALVKALTGIDTDTLPEEQARGVTIDIGFAYWKENVTIIDVPGHERFVKNMVTGVCTVDLALFIVAADDGVMPQTREHLGILNLLGVERGIVALTKTDLVDEDWVELVIDDLKDLLSGTFLDGAPIVPVSSISGEGIEDLRDLLGQEIERTVERPDRGVFRLPIDRVFSVRGFGTVVTGTVLSGSVKPQDEVIIQPSDRSVRVRGVQIHGQDSESAGVGTRAAINLADTELEEVSRGDILAQPGYFSSTFMIDARLQLLSDAPAPVKNRTRVHLHLGPREVLARVILMESDQLLPGESQLVQFRLEEPGVAARGDRYVIRRYSPVQTLGGGTVLDPQPQKHRRLQENVLASLQGLELDDPAQVVSHRLKDLGMTMRTCKVLASEVDLSEAETQRHLDSLCTKGEVVSGTQAGGTAYAHVESWERALGLITGRLSDFHRESALRPGIQRRELQAQVGGAVSQNIFEQAIGHLLTAGKLKSEGPVLSLADHQIRLDKDQEKIRQEIGTLLSEGKASPPDLSEILERVQGDSEEVRRIVGVMQAMGELIRLEDTLLFDPGCLEEMESSLVNHLSKSKEMGVGEFRDLVDTTRKYAVPLLNYFDNRGITIREGDVRVLKSQTES
jgi:selenocysteine-specific elongation factor